MWFDEGHPDIIDYDLRRAQKVDIVKTSVRNAFNLYRILLTLSSYLAGNFAPVTQSWSPTPVSWTGEIPPELHGGMYVRNGGNPATNSDLGREAHWFDGDGNLTGVWFQRPSPDVSQSTPNFVSQFILTDVYLASVEHGTLQTPILPSIATLVNPASSLFWIIWRILRTVFIVLLSHLPGAQHAIKRISVANTSILFHDGRALATCESGPPMRVTLPELETVGWFDGAIAEGEKPSIENNTASEPTFGGTGPLSWMREWTTGHPKVDQATGELVLFHCSFAPPYVQYSVVPSKNKSEPGKSAIINASVPGCTGGKLMHDFGVSKHSTVILDLPLSLTPLNLAKNKPVVLYEPEKPARFGVFPRQDPGSVRWFETAGCCIFHTANTWDDIDADGQVTAVNLLACRLTSASLIFSSANIVPPPHPDHDSTAPKPMSFFAKYDEDEDPEKFFMDETSPLLSQQGSSSDSPPQVPISYDEEEQCRLYYYRFDMKDKYTKAISHQFALSAIPFEFPTVSPLVDMRYARYIYGCSTSNESFGAALGKATKIDLIVRMDVTTLLARAQKLPPENITGCADDRTIDQILASKDRKDPIKAFQLPPNHFAQEPRFIPRRHGVSARTDVDLSEEDGYLIFYVFNEDQLDESGECKANAQSELWVLDAKTMDKVVCRIRLPTRVPYGLHGNWFSEDQIENQREVETLRVITKTRPNSNWNQVRSKIIGSLG